MLFVMRNLLAFQIEIMWKEIAILIIFAIYLIFLESKNGHNGLRMINIWVEPLLLVINCEIIYLRKGNEHFKIHR